MTNQLSDNGRRICFVCPTLPVDAVRGDERLPIDLAYNLAKGLGVEATFAFANEVRPDPENLVIFINTMISKPFKESNFEERTHITVRIDNDCVNSYVQSPDFIFRPFNKVPSVLSGYGYTYSMITMPSRVSVSNLENKKECANGDNRPTVGLVFRNPCEDAMNNVVEISKRIAEKYSSHFSVTCSPNTWCEAEKTIKKEFLAIAGDGLKFFSFNSADKNPYLSMLEEADCLVTSSTLSTTSDLLATGKPVYYLDSSCARNDLPMKTLLLDYKVAGLYNDNPFDDTW